MPRMLTRKGAAVMAPPRLAAAERALLAVLAAGAVVVPLIYALGDDPFRYPKELAFRAEAAALAGLAIFWLTARVRTWRIARGPELAVVAGVLAWAMLTTAFSTNRILSADSLITVAAAAIIFLVTAVAAQGMTLAAVDVLMVAACANAATVILQSRQLWTPFQLSIGGEYANVGFLGNTNDVGMFLVVPALAALIVIVVARGARRWIYAGIAVLLFAALGVSGSRMALAAAVAGVFVFAVAHSWRATIVAVAALIVLALPALSPSTFMGQRVREAVDAARNRDYQRLLSERLVPFLAAADMTRDHPLLGVGPGCFKYHFMAYRVALPARHPPKWTHGWPMNFGEVHNDHLQVASETGLPGYALFLAALAVVAGRPRRGAARETQTAAFARALRWPLVAAIFVVCLAQFPMELAAPRLMMISFAGLCVGWDRGDAA